MRLNMKNFKTALKEALEATECLLNALLPLSKIIYE